LRERLVKTKDKSKKTKVWRSVEPRSDSDEVPRSGRWA